MNLDFITIALIFSVWLVLPAVVFFGTRYNRKRLEREAGALLIECGRSPFETRVLIACGGWLALPIFFSFYTGPRMASIFLVCSISQVMFLLAPYGLFRTQLHEDAVVYSGPMIEGRIVPWRNIGTAEWIEPGRLSRGLSVQLTLQDAKGLRGVAGDKIRFYVPESSRAEVEALIVKKSGAEVLDAASQHQVGITSASSSS